MKDYKTADQKHFLIFKGIGGNIGNSAIEEYIELAF